MSNLARDYEDQERDPSFHSWKRPKRRIKRKERSRSNDGNRKFCERFIGRGKRRTISISKTRKITAKRKKRMEKGSRAFFLGSKPHSNGDSFSRSLDERCMSVRPIMIKRRGTITQIIEKIKDISIRLGKTISYLN